MLQRAPCPQSDTPVRTSTSPPTPPPHLSFLLCQINLCGLHPLRQSMYAQHKFLHGETYYLVTRKAPLHSFCPLPPPARSIPLVLLILPNPCFFGSGGHSHRIMRWMKASEAITQQKIFGAEKKQKKTISRDNSTWRKDKGKKPTTDVKAGACA